MDQPGARKALILLTLINYFNYIDRFILAAVLASIKKDLGLSDFQAGLLATAFMIPYMFTAPLFGWLGDTRNRAKILSFGAALWSLSTFFTGFAKNFQVLMSSRFFLGIGESAFTTTAIPFLSDFFAPQKRGRILAIFSSALPVGAALGYILGGVLGSTVGWRMAFFIVGVPGLLMAIILWRFHEPIPGRHRPDYLAGEVMRVLSRSKPFVLAVLGYCAYTFVVGGVAHWIPTYIQRSFGITEMRANVLFGGIAVGSGLIGTLAGGYLGDFMDRKRSGGHLRISSYSMLMAVPFFWWCLQATELNTFMVNLALTQFFFFLSTSPINVALIESVPGNFRTSAMAISIFASHLLGDAISSPLIGKYSDMTGSLKAGILLCTPVILLSWVFW